MPIPEIVRRTVLKRLQSLDRAARAVVMCAAVAGRRFDVSVVAAAARLPEADARSALERACDLQLLLEVEGDRYAFRHALTLDIVYAELRNARVRPLHRRIARVLEQSRHERDVPLEMLAYHSWAGGDARRALRYNELAGDEAAAVHARADARRYYSRAQSLTEVNTAAFCRLSEKLRFIGDP
jgi:predicted ATPase